MVNTTTCRTSFLAALSKKLLGAMCSIISCVDWVLAANSFPLSAEGGSTTPTPGLVKFTAASPMNSASVVTTSK